MEPHAGSLGSRRGFTLVELLVTVALVGVLLALTGGLYVKGRATARALRCLANQQQISSAMLSFYTDHGRFPSDDPNSNLALQLGQYIPWPEGPGMVALPGVWRCPNDWSSDPLSNSYQPYYVRRKHPAGSDSFVLGCPRHDDVGESYLNLFGVSYLRRARAGRILANGRRVCPAAPTEDRTIHSGSLTFEDGSTATITGGGPEYGITAVASFRNDAGVLYTIVRVQGVGDADFSVTPGSKFEVVTPVAIIGVQGTKFHVTSRALYSRVQVSDGRVKVRTRIADQKKDVLLVSAGESCEVGDPELDRLVLRYVNTDTWRVLNPNEFDVKFKWEALGADDSGRGVVGARSYTHFKAAGDAVRIVYTLRGIGALEEYATPEQSDGVVSIHGG